MTTSVTAGSSVGWLNSMRLKPAASMAAQVASSASRALAAGFDGGLHHVAHLHRPVEGELESRRRPGLALPQHVRDALHVGVEVEVAHAPVDHEQIAPLDDARRGGGLDPQRAGDVDGGHVEGRIESPLEQPVPDPPGHVLERGHARLDDLVGERPLGDLAADLAGLGEGGDLHGRARGPEVGHEALGRDQAFAVDGAQRLFQVEVGGVREPVGSADGGGHVHTDAAGVALGDESGERVRRGEAVVDAALLKHVAAHAQRRALDAPAVARAGEHVVGPVAHVAPAQRFPQRVEQAFAHHHDPHVEIVVLHRPGEDQVELLGTNLAHALPAAARLLPFRGRRGGEAGREQRGREEQPASRGARGSPPDRFGVARGRPRRPRV